MNFELPAIAEVLTKKSINAKDKGKLT